MVYMTPDQIFAAQKKALDDQLIAKKQQEQAILDRRLAEEKREASPAAQAERAAEDRRDMALLMLPLEFAGLGLGIEEFSGAETTQGDPNDPQGSTSMISQLGNEVSAMFGMGNSPAPTTQLGVTPPKQSFSLG